MDRMGLSCNGISSHLVAILRRRNDRSSYFETIITSIVFLASTYPILLTTGITILSLRSLSEKYEK